MQPGISVLAGILAGGAVERVENELFDRFLDSGVSLWLRLVIAVPIGVAIFVYAMRRRSTGVAIVLDLNDGWGPGQAEAARTHALRSHRRSRVAVVTQDLSNDSGDARARKIDLAYSAVQAELLQRGGGDAVRVWLYPVGRLPDLFDVGRRFRLDAHDYRLVYSRTMPADTVRFRHVLRLDLDLTRPLTRPELAEVEEHLAARGHELAPDAPANQAALIVALTDPDQMIASAQKAVHSGESREYRVGPDDRCRSALTIAAPGGYVDPARLPFELVVRYIRHTWGDFLSAHGDPDRNKLLLKCPAVVAMALGSVLGLRPITVLPHIRQQNSHR